MYFEGRSKLQFSESKHLGLKTRIKTGLSHIEKSSKYKLAQVWQYFVTLKRGGRATHLAMVGFSRSGTTLLYNMLRHSCGSALASPDREIRAFKTAFWISKSIATKRPLDILDTDTINRRLASFRNIVYLISIRDPRDLISSRHASVKSQYFQGYDYQLLIGGDSIKSYTLPGVRTIYDKIVNLRQSRSDILSVKYEDLIEDPENIRTLIHERTLFDTFRSFSGFHHGAISPNLSRALNGVRAVEKRDVPAWTHKDRLNRVLSHYQIFPELDEICQELGYPSLEQACYQYNLKLEDRIVGDEGTIVAFHTDDQTYSQEAQRFCARLNQLGLKYKIKTIRAGADWVQNCSLKSSILYDYRKSLRGPLLYLDVDAYVHSNPWRYLSQYDGDAAIYVDKYGEMISSTIHLNDTAGALKLLELWGSKQGRMPQTWDQKVLQSIIELDEQSNAPQFTVQRLPLNMTYIFDSSHDFIFGDIIIEQLQISRELKDQGKGKRVDRRNRRVNALYG